MVARTYEADPDNKEKDKFNLREEWEDLYDDHPNLERVGLSVDKDGLCRCELSDPSRTQLRLERWTFRRLP